MIELALVVICGFLWAIYAAIKSGVAELRNISSRVEVTNGLTVSLLEQVGGLESRAQDIDHKLGSIDDVTTAFHDQIVRAQSRY